MDVKIRPICVSDKETVLNMMVDFYASPATINNPPKEILEKSLDDAINKLPQIEGYVFDCGESLAGYVFDCGESLAGYALVAKGYSTEFGGICVQIEDIYVLPACRGQKIGSTFLKFIENKYKDSAAILRLEAESENKGAVKLYTECGFKPLPYLEMVKKL